MARFNPQREEKEVITLRISTSLLRELEEKSIIFDISRNEMIVQSIRFALDNIDVYGTDQKQPEE